MKLNALIKPLLLYLLFTLSDFIWCHLNKNHSVSYSTRRRTTMRNQFCHDKEGNTGICMFKWDCINKKGITLSTCVDGFLFGACCKLQESFENDISFLNFTHKPEQISDENSTSTSILTNSDIHQNNFTIFRSGDYSEYLENAKGATSFTSLSHKYQENDSLTHVTSSIISTKFPDSFIAEALTKTLNTLLADTTKATFKENLASSMSQIDNDHFSSVINLKRTTEDEFEGKELNHGNTVSLIKNFSNLISNDSTNHSSKYFSASSSNDSSDHSSNDFLNFSDSFSAHNIKSEKQDTFEVADNTQYTSTTKSTKHISYVDRNLNITYSQFPEHNHDGNVFSTQASHVKDTLKLQYFTSATPKNDEIEAPTSLNIYPSIDISFSEPSELNNNIILEENANSITTKDLLTSLWQEYTKLVTFSRSDSPDQKSTPADLYKPTTKPLNFTHHAKNITYKNNTDSGGSIEIPINGTKMHISLKNKTVIMPYTGKNWIDYHNSSSQLFQNTRFMNVPHNSYNNIHSTQVTNNNNHKNSLNITALKALNKPTYKNSLYEMSSINTTPQEKGLLYTKLLSDSSQQSLSDKRFQYQTSELSNFSIVGINEHSTQNYNEEDIETTLQYEIQPNATINEFPTTEINIKKYFFKLAQTGPNILDKSYIAIPDNNVLIQNNISKDNIENKTDYNKSYYTQMQSISDASNENSNGNNGNSFQTEAAQNNEFQIFSNKNHANISSNTLLSTNDKPMHSSENIHEQISSKTPNYFKIKDLLNSNNVSHVSTNTVHISKLSNEYINSTMKNSVQSASLTQISNIFPETFANTSHSNLSHFTPIITSEDFESSTVTFLMTDNVDHTNFDITSSETSFDTIETRVPSSITDVISSGDMYHSAHVSFNNSAQTKYSEKNVTNPTFLKLNETEYSKTFTKSSAFNESPLNFTNILVTDISTFYKVTKKDEIISTIYNLSNESDKHTKNKKLSAVHSLNNKEEEYSTTYNITEGISMFLNATHEDTENSTVYILSNGKEKFSMAYNSTANEDFSRITSPPPPTTFRLIPNESSTNLLEETTMIYQTNITFSVKPNLDNPSEHSATLLSTISNLSATSTSSPFTLTLANQEDTVTNKIMEVASPVLEKKPFPLSTIPYTTSSEVTNAFTKTSHSINITNYLTVPVVNNIPTSTQPTPTTISSMLQVEKFEKWSYVKSCGVRLMQPSGRIVGGENTYFGKWPWQALVKEATWLGLFIKNKCGGVLINAKFVLTAAHCQPGLFAALVVVLGTHDLAGMTLPVIRNVKRMVVHRHYNPLTFENDLALLEMEYKVEFLPHVVPICLPRRQEEFSSKMAYVTGWGKLTHGGGVPNILQEVRVPIMTNGECQNMFFLAGHQKSIRSNFVCAGYSNGGQDSCEGDSGGPLMVQREDKKWVLVGTVSHGIGCADPNLPGVYMRMSSYRPWIDSVINKC